MLFSVVIPVYNRRDFIQEALRSVFTQEFDDYEVIVVDDGSTDGTRSVLASYGDRIRYLHQQNQGPGAARNRGVKAARGEYIAFLDSDDRWFPCTLSTYVQVIKEYGGPSLISSSVAYFQDSPPDPEKTERGSLRVRKYSDFLEAAGEGRYVSTDRVVVKKTAFKEVGGFTTENINAEDHDLAFRLGACPGFVHVEDPELVAVRRHEEQVTHDQVKTWAGLDYLLSQERAGAYPGGKKRQEDRRYLLCQHIRSASLDLAKSGDTHDAFNLYGRSLSWQLRFGRLKYALGFPAVAAWGLLARWKKRATSDENLHPG